MPEPTVDIDAVSRLIREVADDLVMPKFRALRADEVFRKKTAGDTEDIVTVVDRDAETRLTAGLLDITPRARVIGEEAVHAAPQLVDALQDAAPVWIVDPLDGTNNFASGRDAFGIMVAYAVAGHVRAAWIHLPVRGDMFVASAGEGAFCNGTRITVPAARAPQMPRGTLFLRFMPAAVRQRVSARSAGRFIRIPAAGAAAVEYTDIAAGPKDFVVYHRLLPWDHGGPALILVEAGGCVEHLDGRPYTIRSPHQITIVARDTATAEQVRTWLIEPLTERQGGSTG